MFRQVVEERERVLGQEHADTINARYWTARSLYYQKEYKDAEAMFRQAVEERERVLGQEHTDTINARFWTARSLYHQRKYREAVVMFLRRTRKQVGHATDIIGDVTQHSFFINATRRNSTSTLSTISILPPPYGLVDPRPLRRSFDGQSDPWVVERRAGPRIRA